MLRCCDLLRDADFPSIRTVATAHAASSQPAVSRQVWETIKHLALDQSSTGAKTEQGTLWPARSLTEVVP